MTVAAGAFPDVKGSTPISVSRKTPVLNVFKPVSESALADALGDPVDGIVVSYKIVANGGHLDEPGVASVIDKGGVASPAMRIIVLELGSGEKLAL